ncbi:hypothetical protein AAG906_029547 [Vitis piasezkii]
MVYWLVHLFAIKTPAAIAIGFISIDCGISEDSSYTDQVTGIYYTSDATFIDTGISNSISPEFKINSLPQQLWNVRSFPEGINNCYTLRPARGRGNKYLIRAQFMYGNYDAKNQLPEFDLILGVNMWESVQLDNASSVISKEIIHVLSSDYIYVCLVNTDSGIPFISALELRLLDNSMYETQSGSLVRYARWDFGSPSELIRFKDDNCDRFWFPYNSGEWKMLNTSRTIDTDDDNKLQLPSIVMSTAVKPLNTMEPLKFSWESTDPTSKLYIYLYFAEVEELQLNESREFNIFLNGNLWHGPLTPESFEATAIYRISSSISEKFEFSIYKTNNSTLPPIINALEVYLVKQLLQSQTDQKDVDAIMNIKSLYGVKKNWQGDPCAPENYSWEGLNCSYNDYNPPRIISLNLSSSRLTGNITPYISNLTLLQSLDLSQNGLNGPIPDFLSQLPLLRSLNLTGNKLTGSVPVELIERYKNGSLLLSVKSNPELCWPGSCKKKNKFVVPVVVSVTAAFIFLTTLATFWWIRRGRQEEEMDAEMDSNKRQFTYSEVLTITNNLEKVVGKGGFGTVYYGHLDGIQVAVKMLSQSSIQGYKQFQAEAKHLMRVHHRNVTSLIGYCNDGYHMGLIYEYMVNGDLKRHLSDRNASVLSWEERLRIATDAAQGLDYLHDGCKPSIIHRDIKSTNILLNERFQAKLADFGLSRAFPIEGSSHVSTAVVGTPGYLDPEYYVSNRLTEKSDVFSYGVVLLEIITSQPAISKDREKTHIIEWVSCMLANGDIKNTVDPRLQGEFDINSAWKAVEVAMCCVSPTSTERPAMHYVVMELKQCLEMEASQKEGHEPESKDSVGITTEDQSSEIIPIAR